MRSRCVSSPYTITTPYGQVKGYPLNNGFHTGVDYISEGRILSPQDSVVTAIGKDSVNGNYLVLESNGYRDWFSHIKDGGYKVHVNQTVKRGQHIADQGRTGAATGVHVHHSLRKDGVRVDPEQHITEEDMITKEDVGPVRIIMSEVEGWDGHAIHAGKHDKQIMGAWQGKTWQEFIYHCWTVQMTKRHDLTARVTELTKIVSIKENEIKRLQAELATNSDSVQLNALGAALRWLLIRLGLKG